MPLDLYRPRELRSEVAVGDACRDRNGGMTSVPINESPELRTVCRRWMDALTENDTATLANLYSHSAAATYLGTDNEESGWGATSGSRFPDLG